MMVGEKDSQRLVGEELWEEMIEGKKRGENGVEEVKK